jgi:diaminohydroxyphosphoribosylaminopyrimidine deaminase/5-amino-6-(5-phosphoribosylamino)uracil reductase
MTIQSEQFMQQAIDLACKGQGRTAPNPPVGAVVVRDGRIVGKGFHPAAGQPHAEVFALRDAAGQSRGAELYVTLEPCCHQGRTGPCTEAVVKAGIEKVFVGCEDPNPKVAGKGIQALRDAGIKVEAGLLQQECAELIMPFAKHVATGLPYVVYKAAMTMDGQTASAKGDSKWISCEASRRLVHELRNRVDAIAVGAGTVNADDAKLTTRLPGGGRDPVRVVFDGSLSTSPRATLYQQSSDAQTILVTDAAHSEQALLPYQSAGAMIILVDRNSKGLDLKEAMLELGKRNVQHLLLEGGSTLATAMLDAGLIDRMMVFVAPKMLGGIGKGLFAGCGTDSMGEAYKLTNLRARSVETDILIEGEVLNVHRPD